MASEGYLPKDFGPHSLRGTGGCGRFALCIKLTPVNVEDGLKSNARFMCEQSYHSTTLHLGKSGDEMGRRHFAK